MAKNPTIKDIFEREKYDLVSAAKKSRNWFDRQVLMLAKENLTPQKVLAGNPNQLVTKIMPGNLYMYIYDPKMKKELPYYDSFPLVFPFAKTADGFMGLNMHYLPYQLRITLLDRLLVFRNNTRMDETTRLKYSWQLIDGVSRYAPAKPCVKQYLISHVRSQFRQILPEDWTTAMLLPVERFVGAGKQEVWDESRKIIRKA